MNKRINRTLTLLAFATLPVFAGPDAPDAKDMKGMQSPQMMTESDAGPYIAVEGGADVAQDDGNNRIDFRGLTPTAGSDFSYRGDNNDHVGAMGGLKVGYNFESFPVGSELKLQPAIEAEGFYLGSRVSASSTFGGSDYFSVHGDLNSAAFMINGLIRIKTGTIFTPYFGAGAGVEFQTFTDPMYTQTGFGSLKLEHNSNDFAPAVQAIGGFDLELAKHWTLFTEYKFIVAIDPEFNTGTVNFGDGSVYNLKYQPTYMGDHVVSTGIKYNF